MSALSKLMDARVALQGMELKKTGHNKFAGYYYFELGDFLPAVQKIFHGLKLAGIVSYAADLAKLTITDFEDGSEIVVTSPMSEAALKGCHAVQNLGAVETYIRRYLWATAMEIVEHDALDAATGDKPGERKDNGAIVGKGAILPKDGALDSLPEGLRGTVVDVAAEAENMIEAGEYEKAYQLIESVKSGAEDPNIVWVAISGLLGSKSRAYLNGYHAAVTANNMESLIAAFGSIPKYAQDGLKEVFSMCKARMKT